jgi:nucleoside-diphosphate-sugar epimerase
VKLKNNISAIFHLIETFDNMVLDYLGKHPETLYINFSSGAAYGVAFDMPVNGATCSNWHINNISEADYYGIAKFHSEAKHRALKKLNIVDLRIFSYFSRFINLESKFLLTEIISYIKEGKEFITDSNNIVRDYIHPKDLHSLIEKCIEKYKINDVFDAYSLKPVTKFEILDYFKNKYRLNYIVKTDVNIIALTGSKDNYYSNNRHAQEIGYKPQFTSMDSIIQESKEILICH